ncbi:MAG: hemin uptake protein HemP [Pseudorhodoplanes sp.]
MNPQDPKHRQDNAPSSSEGARDVHRQISIVDRRIDSRDLFVSGREITIAHGEEVYRLRLTAQNKLILTK